MKNDRPGKQQNVEYLLENVESDTARWGWDKDRRHQADMMEWNVYACD